MTTPSNEPDEVGTGHEGTPADTDELARHERPEVGLVGDEDLPEDLRPTDDNPLAQDPDETAGDAEDDSAEKVEGVPDMGEPGAAGAPGAPA
jgi:hypothetical protein